MFVDTESQNLLPGGCMHQGCAILHFTPAHIQFHAYLHCAEADATVYL